MAAFLLVILGLSLLKLVIIRLSLSINCLQYDPFRQYPKYIEFKPTKYRLLA